MIDTIPIGWVHTSRNSETDAVVTQLQLPSYDHPASMISYDSVQKVLS